MKLLYFTLSDSLIDDHIREQLVRIPEVLSEIRKVKWQMGSQTRDPVMAFLTFTGNQTEWAEVIQRGLFQRLRKSGFKYSGLLKRSRMSQNRSLESRLVPILQSQRELEIHVVGPGFDDLRSHIERIQKNFKLSCDVQFFDIIREDRKLDWFWAEILGPDHGKSRLLEFDISRH